MGEVIDVEEECRKGLEQALHFLARWADTRTRNACEDIAQEAVIEAWSRRESLRRPDRFGSVVRTIARRRRWRVLQDSLDRRVESHDAEAVLESIPAASITRQESIEICGHRQPTEWLLAELDGAIGELPGLSQSLVRSYYEGFSCVELAERYSLPQTSVKVRIHRIRKRLHEKVTARVRRSTASSVAESEEKRRRRCMQES
ncbi:MAG: sigma-70 family RNA polymerase sigma factor [Planctomycetota bacterium]|jgi:RNA polymerase sigma factor (sigma-70 family)|nr:sigma-70 family RNA polymerase sigma factor [Planctomycetota bacterium]